MIKIDIAVVIVGICYYCFIYLEKKSVPCLFHLITGLKCPLCGATALSISALELDFKNAFMANPLLFVTFPFIIIFYHFQYLKKGKIYRFNRRQEVIILSVMTVYAIIRNICAF